MRERGFSHVVTLIIVAIAAIILYNQLRLVQTRSILQPKSTSTPTATPYAFPYQNPTIPKNDSYRLALVGDSMVAALGPNANTLRLALIAHYPDSEFVNYNFGYGATNVLSLVERLTKTTTYLETATKPILEYEVELIVIESFAYNPLSSYPLVEGIAKQTAELEEAVNLILNTKRRVALAFMTPIAPSYANFAKNNFDINAETRKLWVAERIAYIDNHRKFAEDKGIPVIDVYRSSLGADGLADERFISADFIHPSTAGLLLMSTEIADYIYENRIFPE